MTESSQASDEGSKKKTSEEQVQGRERFDPRSGFVFGNCSPCTILRI